MAADSPPYEFGAIDILEPTTHDNPWPLYTWLREECPLYQDSNGVWVVSRYDDIVSISRDPDTYTSLNGNRPLLPADGSFIHLEGEAHKKRRDLVAEAFGPKAVARMEGHLRDIITGLIDAVIERGETEFVEELAAPLPARIMCEMTGIPLDRAEEVRGMLDAFILAGNGPAQLTEAVNEAFMQFGLLHMDLVEARKEAPTDDLLSLWVHARIDGKPMTEDQLLFEHTMMMVGGSETTRNAISGGIYELARHPEQRQWLIENPDGLPNAIEEIIRWTTPFVSMSRTATRDVAWGDHIIREGDCIKMLYPPANRDPRKFEDAHLFNVRRSFARPHLSFGFGRHFCLGARLARVETQVVLTELLRRMPDWSVVNEPVLASSSFIRGFKRLDLAFTPGPRLGGGPA